MKAKILAIALTIMLVISCFPLVSFALPTNETVLINQVWGGNQKGSTPFDKDFIELYNTGDEAVNLNGYSVGYQSARKSSKQAGGTDGTEVTLALDGYSIPAHSSFLIACAAEATTADLLVCSIGDGDVSWDRVIDNKQYRVALYNGSDLVDAVTAIDLAATTEAAGEGDPVLDVSKQKSVRRVNFADTDNNANDFRTVKYEKASIVQIYDIDEYVSAYAPKSVADGEWTATPTVAENFIGYDFVKRGGYQGPYSSENTVELTDDGLTFDSTVANGYVTADLLPTDTGLFKYAFIKIKTSEGKTASKFRLTIGNIAKSWDQWIGAGALEAVGPVTDEVQTFVLDLEANGVTACTAVDGPDFAINKDGDTADEGTIAIESIRFSNKSSLDTPVKNFIGYDFAGNLGFWGPYTASEDMASLSYSSNGIIFDTSVVNSYFTAELNPQNAPMRKYAKVTLKASDAEKMTGKFSLSIGGVGKQWKDWFAEGADSTITTEFKTFTIDLEANGVTNLVVSNADLALNKSTDVDDEGIVYVQRIEFTNGSYELDDDTPVDPDPEPEKIVGYDFVNKTGYWGPYAGEGMITQNEEGINLDTSVTNSYFTAELDPQDTPLYKYAYVTLKASDSQKMTGEFSLTIGGVGKRWKDWAFAGGITNVAVTEEFQTVAIDLEASGVEALVVDGNDLAFNRSTAVDDEGILTIASIEFKNEAPGEEPDGDLLGYDFVKKTGYWGPYPDGTTNNYVLTEEGLEFDTSVADSYVTAEINPQEIPFYKYAYITIKASDPEKMTGGFSLTLGNAVGKSWKDLPFVDGTDGTLTNEFQTFVVDLEAWGATSLINPKLAPDFALNKHSKIDDEGKVIISSIAFKNEAPEIPEVKPCDLYVSKVGAVATNIADGEDAYFTATIRNLSENASQKYTVSFYVKGLLLETVDVDTPIEADGSAIINTTLGKKVAFGSNTVKVIVSCDSDSDNTNNTAKARFIVD